MARWLPSPKALNNYVEKFESRAIVPPSTLNYVVPKLDEEGEKSLQYENPHMDARDILVLWTMVAGKEIKCPYFMVHHMLEMKKGKSSIGLGYACQWTKIFTWLEIDLSEKKSVVLSNVAKIDDSTLRQMGRDPDAQEPQIQGQPQDPDVQAQSQEPLPPPLPSPTMRDLMDELRSMRVYLEGQFADMRQRQDRKTEAINRQGEAIDLLYTNLGITNPRGIIPRPGP
ncbi:hypothetical protein S83_031707 [Arachis hypogaea]